MTPYDILFGCVLLLLIVVILILKKITDDYEDKNGDDE
jgi:hypothetical protein